MAGNIWENLSDPFTQVHRLKLCRQISAGNEQRQDGCFPSSPRILQSFRKMETELIPL